ncbi:MAG: S46 family peptidase [Ignavibacteriae bacterium]|nr:S46 family peptidase [Ignavibacteriota bacterium]NOG99568.1 S46 family peptidase [Ignavibacteriota bacterium]
MKLRNQIFSLSTILLIVILSSCSSTKEMETLKNDIVWLDVDTVKAQRFDTGRMWTFEHAPTDYFYEEYGFKPNDEWLNKVRMSALRFASWCSASFVSADGLIITNHHCIDMIADKIQREGENIFKNGFIAEDLKDERRVPDLFVDQLAFIKDVTDEVNSAAEGLTSKNEIVKMKQEKISELEKLYSEETGLRCRVTPLYNGGKYSLYGYRRYDDVRVVFFAESEMGLYGGDPDNFTYPRYNLDCAFLRVYDENGEPLQSENYLPFSNNGIVEGEPLFVVGNPGSTKRLKTVAQLEYYRDISYKNSAATLQGLQAALEEQIQNNPEKIEEYQKLFISVSNSAKVYSNELKGMRDPYLMARKKDFEESFKSKVMADPKLKVKYSHVWKAIEDNRNELRKYAPEIYAYRISRLISPKYYSAAAKLLKMANQLKLPEEQRDEKYNSENLDSTIAAIFPADIDQDLEIKKLALQADLIRMNLGDDHSLVLKMFKGKKGAEAAEYVLSNSLITSKADVVKLAGMGSEAIINSDDPFIYFTKTTTPVLQINMQLKKEIDETEEMLEEELGQALYEVYGTEIPPDATFTLRITDCVMKGYEYNGTIAPKFTTFYGLYDRYYSHEKIYPWDISEKWKNPDEDFDMSTPFNFVATCDITGGASGSPVINQRAEVIGLAFDGNIESIPAGFLFTTEKNRMVGVTAEGMIEAIENVYRFERLSNELKKGKLEKK